MAKYLTAVPNLVFQAKTNAATIKNKAKDNDPEACFWMGMIHLLALDTELSFEEASAYLENQSLADDPDANRLLGFIEECEGYYASAFEHYAKAANIAGRNGTLFHKIFEERNDLQAFFKRQDLPSTVLSPKISSLLNDYVSEGENPSLDICIKLSSIYYDESSCLQIAQMLYEKGELFAAKRWLLKGEVSRNNKLYVSLEKKIAKYKKELNFPDIINPIDLKGESFLEDSKSFSYDLLFFHDENEGAGAIEWIDKIYAINKKRQREEEENRIRREKEKIKSYSLIGAMISLGILIIWLFNIIDSFDAAVKVSIILAILIFPAAYGIFSQLLSNYYYGHGENS